MIDYYDNLKVPTNSETSKLNNIDNKIQEILGETIKFTPAKDEILEYAKFLGMDIKNDQK